MAENNSILDKLEGLVSRYEEVGTLITDPNVISDQKRYVKLTKEYKDLGDIMKARKEYIQLLGNIEEAKNILSPANVARRQGYTDHRRRPGNEGDGARRNGGR